MTQSEYESMTLAQMQARRWRTATEVSTVGGLTMAAGIEVRVIGKRDGLNIVAPKCFHCGVSFTCRRVRPGELVEITDGEGGQG